MSFSLTSIRSSLFALSVVLSMPGNAAATLLKSCQNIMSTNNIKKSQSRLKFGTNALNLFYYRGPSQFFFLYLQYESPLTLITILIYITLLRHHKYTKYKSNCLHNIIVEG